MHSLHRRLSQSWVLIAGLNLALGWLDGALLHQLHHLVVAMLTMLWAPLANSTMSLLAVFNLPGCSSSPSWCDSLLAELNDSSQA